MMASWTHRLLIIATASAALCSTPTESHALCDWLRDWCWAKHACPTPQTAMYGMCPQTCQYVPQTSFRTETTAVPVTSFRPVTTCNPCTGCPQTCMQPVTTMVQQTRMVPVTSYRLVFANAAPAYAPVTANFPAASGCSTCGTTAPAATTTMFAPATVSPATSGCSTCAGGASLSPATTMYAPSTTLGTSSTLGYATPSQLSPESSMTQPYPSAPAQTYLNRSPTTTTPNPVYTQSPTPTPVPVAPTTPKTYADQPDVTNPKMAPIPDVDHAHPSDGSDGKAATPANPTSAPQLHDPINRTTQMPPSRPVWAMTSAERTAAAQPVASTSAWRNASAAPESTTSSASASPWRPSR